MLLLLSVFALCFVSAVSADEVFIHINSATLNEINITKTYTGIGDVQITKITDNTLQVNIANFIDLFAPVGATTATYPSVPRKLVIEDILDSITITDESGVSRPLTLNDVEIEYGNSIRTIYTCELLQYTYKGQDYSTTIQGSGYIVGWRNNRGAVSLDGNDISDKLYPDWYSPVLFDGNHTLSTVTGDTGGCGYTVIDLTIISLDTPLTVSGQFSHPKIEKTFMINPIKYPIIIYAEPGAIVYIDGTNAGTTDNEGKLTVEIPAGTHNMNIIFTNGISAEKTVEVTADGNNTVSFEYGTVNIKVVDGLSGESLAGVSVSGNLTTTISGTYETNMPYGEYILEFSKDGYWSENKTIEVDGDNEITVQLFPTTTIFKVSSEQQGVKLFPNSEATIYLDVKPVKDTYGGLLYIDGITIKSVKDENGVGLDYQNAYVIGDLKEGESKKIRIDVETDDTVGDRAIQIRLKGNDILGNEYTTDYQLGYTILDLPVSVVVPSKWVIGKNDLKISELNGEDKVIFVQLYRNETLLDSQSYAFNGWETHTYELNINKAGDYYLIISASDFSTKIPFTVVNPIQVVEKTITAPAGEDGTVKIEIYNPGTEPVYYKLKVSGECLENESIMDVSIAPGLTKTFEVPIKIIDNPEFDSYNIKVQVLDINGAIVEFEDSVICNIEESSGFILGLDDDFEIFGIPALYIGIGALLLVGGFFIWRWI